MKNFIIFTDSNCDLPANIIKDLNLEYASLSCHIDENDYLDDCGQSLPYKDFYNYMREGAMPTTSQVNSYTFYEKFEPYVKSNVPILYIAFSSPLSGTYNSSLIAREELLEKYPNAQITIIDSLCASGGCALLVYYATKLKESGKSLEEVSDWVEKNKKNVLHYFTVDDLNHLKRGGRISATTAMVGSVLNIKPILTLNGQGKLESIGKVKGRKKSMKTLLEYLSENIINPTEQTVMIVHGDCEKDAEYLSTLIKEELNVKEVIINYSGLVIGSHVGPGMIAAFAMGKERP